MSCWVRTLVLAGVAVGAFGATPTTVSLSESPNSARFGQAVTLTATVAPSVATGRVTFYDGTTVLGVAAVTGGRASLTTSLLASGVRSIKAYYSGDASYGAAISMAVTQRVTPVAVTWYGPPSSYQTQYGGAVAVGDFNGDGKTDFVVANISSLTVYLGNGDGTFQAGASYDAYRFTSVITSDFNGDGQTDLALFYDGTVAIVLGNGDGTFHSRVEYDAGLGATQVC